MDTPGEESASVGGQDLSSDDSLQVLQHWNSSDTAIATKAPAEAPVAAAFFIHHVQSGRCLDGSISQGVRLITCNGSTYQQWYTTTGWNYVHVQSGRCLDGSISQGVRLNSCNGSTYQQWGSTNGLDFVHVQSGRCLDGSISQGVRVNSCNGSAYQQWY
jgi:hypothetical protein